MTTFCCGVGGVSGAGRLLLQTPGDWSTTRNPTSFRIKIDENPSRDFLAKFEDGGSKESVDRAFPIAIPSSNIRASRAELVPRALYPTSLRLVERRNVTGSLARREHRTRRGVLQVKGKRGTFILDPQEHFSVKTWGVYQRLGPDRSIARYSSAGSNVRLLWTFKRRIPIPPLLRFEATARDVVARRFQIEFASSYARALATRLLEAG